MKKFRLFSALLVSAFAINALSSCTGINDELPDPQTIIKDGLNINSITFENVPDELKVGYFDSYKIYLKIVYSDNSEEQYPLTMGTLPKSVKHLFNVVGNHTITIAFRGQEVPYTFNVVPGREYFAVTYYSYDGSVVQREEVNIDDEGYAIVTKAAPTCPNRPEDTLYIYSNPRWEEEIAVGTELIGDFNIYPIYDRAQKRYNNKELVSTTDGNPFRILNVNRSGAYNGIYSTYLHVGRLERVPLAYSEPVEKTTSSIHASLYFDNSTSEKITNNTEAILREIHSKAFDVNTSNYSTYFTTLGGGGSHKIDNPNIYNGEAYDIRSTLGDNPLTMLEGDTSYTPIYVDNIYSFVKGLDEDHKDEFDINFPDDLLPTSTNYYRGAIEGSVDVIMKVTYEYREFKTTIELRDLEYYFLYNKESTFHNPEYSNTTNFVAVGNKLSFNMQEFSKVLKDAVTYE